MKYLLVVALLTLTDAAQAQSEPEQEIPKWIANLIFLGDAFEQWCKDKDGEYARDENHQLAPGGQWRCYVEIPEPEGKG